MQLDEQGVGNRERPTLVLSSGRTEDGGGWLGEQGVEDNLVSAQTKWSRHGIPILRLSKHSLIIIIIIIIISSE
jgi:hypothetical protein